MTGLAVSIQHTSILLVNLNCDHLVLNFSKLLKKLLCNCCWRLARYGEMQRVMHHWLSKCENISSQLNLFMPEVVPLHNHTSSAISF